MRRTTEHRRGNALLSIGIARDSRGAAPPAPRRRSPAAGKDGNALQWGGRRSASRKCRGEKTSGLKPTAVNNNTLRRCDVEGLIRMFYLDAVCAALGGHSHPRTCPARFAARRSRAPTAPAAKVKDVPHSAPMRWALCKLRVKHVCRTMHACNATSRMPSAKSNRRPGGASQQCAFPGRACACKRRPTTQRQRLPSRTPERL